MYIHEGNIYYIQGEAHKVLQSDSTQTIDHIQKCFRQKFQHSRRPSYWTNLFLIGGRQGQLHFFKSNHVFTRMTLCCRSLNRVVEYGGLLEH